MAKIPLSLEPLINREFLQKQTSDSADFQSIFARKTLSHPSFITVSREPGSGGKLIAKRLAQHLGYKFYDKELTDQLKTQLQAEKINLRDVTEKYFDERDVSGVEEFINGIIYPNLITQDYFVKHLVHLITALSLKGKCVILGRGANFFTDHRFGFHVRITAPLEFRVKNTMRYEHLSEKAARERVGQFSRQRRKFVEKYFSTHVDNSEFYDLVLNRAYFSLDEAVNLILNAFKKKMKG